MNTQHSLRTALWVALLAAAFCPSCERTVAEPLAEGYEYFPLEVGRAWIYQSDTILFDPAPFGTRVDTLRGQVREVVVDTVQGLTGEIRYRIERYTRTADTLPWQIDRVLALWRDDRRAYRLEDNLQLVEMVFPIRPQHRWTPTVLLDEELRIPVAGEPVQVFKGWQAVVQATDDTRTTPAGTFTDVLTLTLADNENLLERRFATAQYAPGVGLIHRELWAMDTQCAVCCSGNFPNCEALPWPAKAERGLMVQQTLIGWE